MKKRGRKRRKKSVYDKAEFVVPLLIFFLGNRIFNHFNAWLGVSMIIIGVIYLYFLIKKIIVK